MTSIYLRAPAYASAAQRPIEELPALQADADMLGTLLAVGLESYAHLEGPLEDLAAQAIGKTLQQAATAPGDVDVIVMASTLYAMGGRHDTEYPSRLMQRIVKAAGLRRATPCGVSFSQCVNIVSAIELARGLVSEGRQHVLIVTADAMPADHPRIVEPGISVTSDVASCLLVSAERGEGPALTLNAVRTAVDWDLLDVSPKDDFPEYLRRTVQGMKAASTLLMETEGLKPGDYAQLLTNTINRSVVRIFSQATGVPVAKVFQGNVGRLAHCDAADIVINLAEWMARGDGRPLLGDRVLMAANGPYLWGAVSASVC